MRDNPRVRGPVVLRTLLLWSTFIWSSAIVKASPAALGVLADSEWIGVDGAWSSHVVNIGTPPQIVSLIPSTTAEEIWTVGFGGCDRSLICGRLRGGLFMANQSSSFQAQGMYDLGLNQDAWLSGTGYYGFDTVQLSDQVSTLDQTIAVINYTASWTGILGLGIGKTRVGSAQASPALSLLPSLAQGGRERQIPSLSYGYTAGAPYKLKRVPSSLTLGGYDANRFKPNNMTFNLDPDQQPVLAVKSISIGGWLDDGTDYSILGNSDAAFFRIDSTTPYLWLPEKATKRFEEIFSVVYNEKLNLYTYPAASTQATLQNLNMTFEFTLSDLVENGQEITIPISGQALLNPTMQLSYGFPDLNVSAGSPGIPYLPVRKANSSDEYIIGRSFLQEAYLIVNYETGSFSLSEAKFSQDAVSKKNLIDIPSNSTTDDDEDPAATTNSGISTGAWIGIGVGIAAFITIVMGTIAVLYFRKQRKASSQPRKGFLGFFLSRGTDPSVPELPVDGEHIPIKSLSGSGHNTPNEVSGEDIKELPEDDAGMRELPGSPGSSGPYTPGGHTYPVGYDPTTAIELPHRSSLSSFRFGFEQTQGESAVSSMNNTMSPSGESQASPLVSPLTPGFRLNGSGSNGEGTLDSTISETGRSEPTASPNPALMPRSRSAEAVPRPRSAG